MPNVAGSPHIAARPEFGLHWWGRPVSDSVGEPDLKLGRPAMAPATAFSLGDRSRYDLVLANVTDYIESVSLFDFQGKYTFYSVAVDLAERWETGSNDTDTKIG